MDISFSMESGQIEGCRVLYYGFVVCLDELGHTENKITRQNRGPCTWFLWISTHSACINQNRNQWVCKNFHFSNKGYDFKNINLFSLQFIVRFFKFRNFCFKFQSIGLPRTQKRKIALSVNLLSKRKLRLPATVALTC